MSILILTVALLALSAGAMGQRRAGIPAAFRYANPADGLRAQFVIVSAARSVRQAARALSATAPAAWAAVHRQE